MMNDPRHDPQRRQFLAATLAAGAALTAQPDSAIAADGQRKAQIAISLDLEMSRNFPTWETTHWDYEKGNLDEATKRYAVEAARRVKARGGRVHFFCVGRVLEQENIDWIKELIREGHKIGNHTYDHVNIRANNPAEVQFRFQRAPWLVEGKSAAEIIAENVGLCRRAMKQRLGIDPAGFRAPGGFADGIADRPDIQRMLQGQGYSWVSTKYPGHPMGEPGLPPPEELLRGIDAAQAAAQPFAYPSGLIEVPMSPISDIGAFRNGRWPLAAFLEAIRRGVSWAVEHRAVFDLLSHPSCLVVTDPHFQAVELVCDLANAAGDRAALVDLDTIAQGVTKPGPTRS